MSFLPQTSLAQDFDGGLYLRSGFGTVLEGRGQRPLTPTGRSLSVEAGLSIPGEASFAYELGLRGRVLSPRAELESVVALRALSFTAGARVRVGVFPSDLGLVPVLSGGLQISSVHDRDLTGFARSDDRLSFGPHFAFSLERALGDAAIALRLESRVDVVPLVVELGLAIEISAR